MLYMEYQNKGKPIHNSYTKYLSTQRVNISALSIYMATHQMHMTKRISCFINLCDAGTLNVITALPNNEL